VSAFEHLLAPGRIGTLALRNRILMAPMGEELAELDGTVGDRQLAYVEARAAGGVALVSLGSVAIAWPAGTANECQNGISSDHFEAGIRRLADTAHAQGAALALQLTHMGKVARNDIVAGRPMQVPSLPGRPGFDPLMAMITPDELEASIAPMQAPTAKVEFHEMTHDDIALVVAQFADATARAQAWGVDAVELHAGHGYLIDEFLSPASNHRTDDYGGPVEQRARFLLEVIAAIRAEVGRDYPLWARINGHEVCTEGGETLDDARTVARLAADAGLDAIHVSAYGDPNVAISFTESHTPHEPGHLVALARAVKGAVDIPVITVGRIEADVGDALIADGACDFVAMGRKLLADPELPNKLASGGGADDVRPCLYHYRCISNIFVRKGVQCVSNPMVGRERELSVTPAANARRVTIVGGGPAGMEAARIAALRGHHVVLHERDGELGGRLRFAARTYEPNADLLQWLIRQVTQLDIDVRLESEFDAGALTALDTEVLIDATGGNWAKPTIDGAHLPHVRDLDACRAWVLDDGALPDGDVVVIGGGRAGCGLADLAHRQGHPTTVLEPSNVFAVQFGLPGRWRYVHDLRTQGVSLVPDATVDRIDADGVHYTVAGDTHAIAAATVITVNRVDPTDPLATNGVETHRIGDCTGPRWLEGSLLDATSLAVAL
jgi:2,4-dienoyl-CoA reductase (NADPH2)